MSKSSKLPLVITTAPEKIYLQIADDCYYEDQTFPDEHDDHITWCADSVESCEVPYIRADLATPAQTVDVWHPIETAPKDGTEVDLWTVYNNEGSRLANAVWTTPEEDLGESPCWCEYTTDFHGYGEWGFYPVNRDAMPTHWMPLPLPPERAIGEGEST